MDKFKVEYTETRYFTVEVEANNEDDAAELATYIADRDGLFQYRNEDTAVERIEA